MTTFIVWFVDEAGRDCRGKVRRVAGGEEAVFADEVGLLAFFRRMNALGAMERANETLVEAHRAEGADGLPGDTPPAGR